MMKISPRKKEFDEKAKTLIEKVISELPKDFIAGVGEATAHFSQADGGTIKIYPTPNTFSFILGMTYSRALKGGVSDN